MPVVCSRRDGHCWGGNRETARRPWGWAAGHTPPASERLYRMTLISDLVLERREQADPESSATFIEPDGSRTTVMMTPPISEDYWMYRVRVADGQAVVGFPKFFTVGIGFAVEEDWNTNLPYRSEARDIAHHIWRNRAPLPDDVPSFDLVVAAIEMIQSAVAEDIEKTA